MEERIRIARSTFGAWPDKPEPMSKWEWAALWKRVAKGYRQANKLYLETIPRFQVKYWSVKRWAALWKRAAKKNRCELRKYKAAWQLQKELNRDMTLEVIALRIELDRIADAKASGEIP